jgi:hypothetical protein
MVAHTCNLIYSRGRDQEDCESRIAQAKAWCGGMCLSSQLHGLRVALGKNMRLYLKNNERKKGWDRASSGCSLHLTCKLKV